MQPLLDEQVNAPLAQPSGLQNRSQRILIGVELLLWGILLSCIFSMIFLRESPEFSGWPLAIAAAFGLFIFLFYVFLGWWRFRTKKRPKIYNLAAAGWGWLCATAMLGSYYKLQSWPYGSMLLVIGLGGLALLHLLLGAWQLRPWGVTAKRETLIAGITGGAIAFALVDFLFSIQAWPRPKVVQLIILSVSCIWLLLTFAVWVQRVARQQSLQVWYGSIVLRMVLVVCVLYILSIR